MELSSFPKLNALLNSTSALLLLLGFIFIRRRNIAAHRLMMVSAFGVSTLFLVSYLYYHAHAGSTRFTGVGWIRPVYFTILISHTILATIIVPMILRTVFLAAKNRFEEHRALAKWTWPLWMYTSVTGVVIYLMLYHWPL